MYSSYSINNFFSFTELLLATNQQTNITFIDNVLFYIGYEDHFTSGGCTDVADSICLSQQGT